MTSRPAQPPQMRLYSRANLRLYINAAERARFVTVAQDAPPRVAALGLTLLYTGCRISEALALRASSIQDETRVLTFRTLKRRDPHCYREVPVPPDLIARLQVLSASDCANGSDHLLWRERGHRVHRVTAYRWIKALMATAEISGAQACPKGLRHGYGIHALRVGVPLNMLQKWMGHASMSTTAIYADASGVEELAIADRMWRELG